MPVAKPGRRRFLGASAASIGGLILGCRDGDEDGDVGADLLAEGQPLRSLASLANESTDEQQFSATLIAAPAEAAMVPGRSTVMSLYNGMGPGPLIELREGQRVRITLDEHNGALRARR